MLKALTYIFRSFLLLLMIVSCKENKHEYHGLVDKINQESVDFARDSIVERSSYRVDNLQEIYENEMFNRHTLFNFISTGTWVLSGFRHCKRNARDML